jgi:predicted peroxiredoxin
MKKNLGIYVSSDQHLEKLIKLCRAAKKKGVEVNIFFTHLGVKLTSHPRFKELEELAF